MDFASSYVYVAEEEDVGEGGLFDDGEKCEDAVDAPVDGRKAKGKADESRSRRRGKVAGKRSEKLPKRGPAATTNIVNISLGRLQNKSCAATGDVTACAACGGVLSCFSELKRQGGKAEEAEEDGGGAEGEAVWKCEYCDHTNEVVIMEEERPVGAEIDYVLEVPTASSSDLKPRYIFCIDVSGSMCVSVEMQGKQPERLKAINAQNAGDWGDLDGMDVYKPSNVWYLSRLQAMQAAIDRQLDTLPQDCYCGIVTFANEVTVYGEGEPVVIAGEHLMSEDAIAKKVQDVRFELPIKEAKEQLRERLWKLAPSGATALCPAVVASVALAAHSPGSTVTLATDGLANVGLGSLDGIGKACEEAVEQKKRLYESIGERAMKQNTVINTLSIASEGESVSLSIVGQLSAKTKGRVELVRPESIGEELEDILRNDVVAYDISVTIITNKHFSFDQNAFDGRVGAAAAPASAPSASSSSSSSSSSPALPHKMEKFVGVAGSTTEVPFEFRSVPNESKKMPSKIPFQVQIRYTRLDGTKAVRVITKVRDSTTDRKAAEKHVNVAVLSSAVNKKAVNLAAQGEYEEARAVARINNVMLRNANVSEDQKSLIDQYENEIGAMDAMLDEFTHEEQNANMRIANQGDVLSVAIHKQSEKEAAACVVM